jgi:hypothetical protein
MACKATTVATTPEPIKSLLQSDRIFPTDPIYSQSRDNRSCVHVYDSVAVYDLRLVL